MVTLPIYAAASRAPASPGYLLPCPQPLPCSPPAVLSGADLLADRIAIMAHGRLAALGTSLELKSQFGVGYTLTLSLCRPDSPDSLPDGPAGSEAGSGGGSAGEAGRAAQAGSSAADVERLTALVQSHVPQGRLISARGGACPVCRLVYHFHAPACTAALAASLSSGREPKVCQQRGA